MRAIFIIDNSELENNLTKNVDSDLGSKRWNKWAQANELSYLLFPNFQKIKYIINC